MREIAPQHMTTIELRTYVALYDLCIQQSNLNKAKQEIIEGYSPSDIKNQNELLIYVCKKRLSAPLLGRYQIALAGELASFRAAFIPPQQMV